MKRLDLDLEIDVGDFALYERRRCPPGSLPALTRTRRAKNGVVEKVGDWIAYVSARSDDEAIIVISMSTCSSADQGRVPDALAASGFHVAMLDVYRGTSITELGAASAPRVERRLKQ